MRRAIAGLCALCAWAFISTQAFAQSIAQDEALSFGMFGIDVATADGDITVTMASVTSATGAFFVIVAGTAGGYTVTGLPVSTAVTLTASQVDPLDTPANGASAYMPLTDFLLPGSPVSDPSGVLVFEMGVTASTRVNSTQYNAGDYTGVVLVTVAIP